MTAEAQPLFAPAIELAHHLGGDRRVPQTFQHEVDHVRRGRSLEDRFRIVTAGRFNFRVQALVGGGNGFVQLHLEGVVIAGIAKVDEGPVLGFPPRVADLVNILSLSVKQTNLVPGIVQRHHAHRQPYDVRLPRRHLARQLLAVIRAVLKPPTVKVDFFAGEVVQVNLFMAGIESGRIGQKRYDTNARWRPGGSLKPQTTERGIGQAIKQGDVHRQCRLGRTHHKRTARQALQWYDHDQGRHEQNRSEQPGVGTEETHGAT